MEYGQLSHHGIKGMRWGIRRYQNKDGSLTEAGRRRRAKLEAELNKLDGKKAATPEVKPRKKSMSEMDDDELVRAIRRSQLENEYRRLNPEPVAQPSKGKQFVSTLMTKVIAPAAISAGSEFTKKALGKLGDKLLKDKNIDPNSTAALEKAIKKLELEQKYKKLKKGGQSDEDIEAEAKRLRNQSLIKKYKKELGIDDDPPAKKTKDSPDDSAEKKDKDAKTDSKSNDKKDDTPVVEADEIIPPSKSTVSVGSEYVLAARDKWRSTPVSEVIEVDTSYIDDLPIHDWKLGDLK